MSSAGRRKDPRREKAAGPSRHLPGDTTTAQRLLSIRLSSCRLSSSVVALSLLPRALRLVPSMLLLLEPCMRGWLLVIPVWRSIVELPDMPLRRPVVS